jgi:cytosine/adenosine deaminase-related metal-dependent hydrolase
MRARVFHADGVIPGDGVPFLDGAVVVSQTGAIVEVGKASDVLPRHAELNVERIRGVIFPGLINAHTHVELSAMRGKVPGGAGFVPWVERLVTTRPELDESEVDEAVERSARDLARYGTAAVGEVTNALSAVGALARNGIGGWIFHEVFGVDRAQVMKRIEGARSERAERFASWPTTDLAYAPAPHTLYTTHPDAVRELLANARNEGLVTSLHLAEHPAERSALESGEGPLMGWYQRRLGLDPSTLTWPYLSPVAFADELGALDPRVLLVHLADARPEELDRVAERGSPVVLCPRSNLYIESRLPPLLAMIERGIEPALGTDSLASNASLDVLAEARALADRFPGVPAADLVTMATWNGARALSRPDLGRFAPGTQPGVLAVEGKLSAGQGPAQFLLANVSKDRRWLVRRAKIETPTLPSFS